MKFLRFLGNEIVLGTLIALLSVFTAVASYQGSIADSKQNESEVKASTATERWQCGISQRQPVHCL